MKKPLSLLVCTLTLSLAGCKEKDQLNNMHDSTVKVGETTEKMNKVTNELDFKSYYLTVMARNKETEETRDRKFSKVLDSTLGSGRTFEDKTKQAASYFNALEFQVWANIDNDPDGFDYREDLFYTALSEFYRGISGLMKMVDLNKLGPQIVNEAYKRVLSDEENILLGLAAFSAAMHERNHLQEDLHTQVTKRGMKSYPLVDMLTLTKEGLLTANDSVSGQKPYQVRLAVYHEEAKKLLNLRLNTLTFISMNKALKLNSETGKMENAREGGFIS